MILDIYKDSLEYSAKDWKTLIILGVISIFSFLLLPAFLITGYNYRVINTAVHGIINGRDPMPEFDGIIDMFIDGVKIVVVQIVYLLVPVVIFLIFALVASQLIGVASTAIMLIGSLIAFVALVISCLMSQMGICHMAYNDGALSKAFAISEIKEVIDEIGWFECIITYVGLIIITVVLSLVVTTIIGLIFTVFGLSGFALGVDASGIFALGALINILITTFIVGPYLSIFNSRSIGLLYTTQI
ncbi:MAG: DUF4013 domain-containing protein [Methanobrevibacter sp.]|uniref:DUF4013 domain-containing protein n=1 Tax=Methanobrevibacter sp. TaxID=66852 RepID=UPI0025E2D847|nr:DUF4013 domain-containing protein [Methanobrevibacter sp.]MBR0271553.1 DUF4013 domain-containing protein [Methanobrevibacter sp.]